ncbi:hypothetical protein K9B35_00930 [Sphingomonas sp. R647]|uniref:hypothetical protein n=1 Tax=Sphingomonas sp. R647 TaxID=2875233 RepID=UPI001CD3A612|nr:hypothetical protein [Sphingomonas sp. R647]MCA1196521.1 hypothetical protein [Sphingomonas sp. R647]
MRMTMRKSAATLALMVPAIGPSHADAGRHESRQHIAHCALAATVVADKPCRETRYGAVIGESDAEAGRLAALVAEGEIRFERHFGRPPPRHLLGQGITPDQRRALTAAGFVRTLPWLTAGELEEQSLSSIRRGIEGRPGGLPAGPERLAAVEKAQQAWRASSTLEKRHAQDAGVVPHEMAHGWYVSSFWPGVGLDRGGHYGGPGPDWLDETAAVLAEGDAFTDTRRQGFAKVYQGKQPANTPMAAITVSELLDLDRFLHQEHPMNGLQQPLIKSAATRGGQTVVALTGEEAQRAARGGIVFYMQSRLFADFLIERTGDLAVFGSIAEAFSRGETIEQWLAANGKAKRLGATVPLLQSQWLAWLAARYGPQAEG